MVLYKSIIIKNNEPMSIVKTRMSLPRRDNKLGSVARRGLVDILD